MARRNIVGERPPPLRPFYTVMKHEGDDDAEKLMREGVLDPCLSSHPSFQTLR